MRNWYFGLCLAFFPAAALADELTLEDFAAFEGQFDAEAVDATRAAIVSCLQQTRTPSSCIGVTLVACKADPDECATLEAAAWERFGYDIYLALRTALGGPDWIDAAHTRIGGEMDARCAALTGDAARLCPVNEAASRAIDLRFALVSP